MMTVWERYLEAVQHLHDTGRRIVAIGVKPNPSQEELNSIDALLAEHATAERVVSETIQAARAELRVLRGPKGRRPR